jgi:excinuclease ABC subunit C
MAIHDLKEQMSRLPHQPGVYIYSNAAGETLYVGKARSLRDRVRSYLGAYGSSPRHDALLDEAARVEVIVTDSVVEALALENNLIKQRFPRYNILLRDDKNYPYLQLTTSEAFPRVLVARQVEKGVDFFAGPFLPAKLARRTMSLTHRMFGIRSCNEVITGQRARPCLEFDIGRCLAPCVVRICSEERYAVAVADTRLFLEGRNQELADDLRERMTRAAREERFEEAAQLRDAIRTVTAVSERQQKMATAGLNDRDVFGVKIGTEGAVVQVFVFRGGRVIERFELQTGDGGRVGGAQRGHAGQDIGRDDRWRDRGADGGLSSAGGRDGGRDFSPAAALENPAGALENPAGALENPAAALENPAGALENPAGALENAAGAFENPAGASDDPAAAGASPAIPVGSVSEAELLEIALQQLYTDNIPPPEIHVPIEPLDKDVLEAWLSARAARKIRIVVPQRGDKKDMVELAQRNAGLAYRSRFDTEATAQYDALDMLKGILKLPALPRRIECFDISTIQGSETVASMVVCEDGRMKRGEYRKYRVRRSDAEKEPAPFSSDPEKGAGPFFLDDFAAMKQVVGRRYRKVMAEGGPFPDLIVIDGGKGQLNAAYAALEEIGLSNLVAIGLAKKEELVFVRDSDLPIAMDPHGLALRLLQRIRDEAHRFAVTFHRRARTMRDLRSEIDSVPGIGPRRRKALLITFGSVAGVRRATREELTGVVGPRAADAILQFFGANP